MILQTEWSRLLKASGCKLPVNLHGSSGLDKASQRSTILYKRKRTTMLTHLHTTSQSTVVDLSQELDSPLARSEPVHGRKRLVLTSGRSLAPLHLRHCALLSKDECGAVREPEVDLGNVSKYVSSQSQGCGRTFEVYSPSYTPLMAVAMQYTLVPGLSEVAAEYVRLTLSSCEDSSVLALA
jgi:hypothetical protein